MKRLIPVFLCLLLVLWGCRADPVRTVEYGGTSYTVDTEKGTIEDGTFTYAYQADGNTVTITYPDGSSYWYTSSRSGQVTVGTFGWSDDYRDDRYVSGGTLENVLDNVTQSGGGNGGIILGGLALCALGAWYAVAPRSAWYLEWGWRYKNAEPSDAALTFGRAAGVVLLVVGVIALIFGFQ